MGRDEILAELDQVRAGILAEFGGDFDAYLDYRQTLESENPQLLTRFDGDVDAYSRTCGASKRKQGVQFVEPPPPPRAGLTPSPRPSGRAAGRGRGR